MGERQCKRCKAIFIGLKRRTYCSKSCAGYARAGTLKPTSSSFQKGGAPWNKGLKDWRKGYRHSARTIEAIRVANSGEDAPNWKGGLTEKNYRIRRSRRYGHWRTAVFVRDNYTCQLCGVRSAKGKRVRLQADHIKPFALYPDLRFDVENGRTLCEGCHRSTATWGHPKKAFTGQRATKPDGMPYGSLA